MNVLSTKRTNLNYNMSASTSQQTYTKGMRRKDSETKYKTKLTQMK